jgi:hypothetical protein
MYIANMTMLCSASLSVILAFFLSRKTCYKGNYKSQITFFASEVFGGARPKLDLTGQSLDVLRRNVIIVGMDLNASVGEEFFL